MFASFLGLAMEVEVEEMQNELQPVVVVKEEAVLVQDETWVAVEEVLLGRFLAVL